MVAERLRGCCPPGDSLKMASMENAYVPARPCDMDTRDTVDESSRDSCKRDVREQPVPEASRNPETTEAGGFFACSVADQQREMLPMRIRGF
jgi:hypothetical protein